MTKIALEFTDNKAKLSLESPRSQSRGNFWLESMIHNHIIGLQLHRFGLENISQ